MAVFRRLHLPAPERQGGEGDDGCFVRPILDVARGVREGQSIEIGFVVLPEPRKHGEIVAAFKHVHRVELQEPEALDGRGELTDSRGRRMRAAEPLGGEGDPLCLRGGERGNHKSDTTQHHRQTRKSQTALNETSSR